MDDLISRQAAIELIHTLYPSEPFMQMNRKRWEKKYKPYIESEKALERLPSAQTEITEELVKEYCRKRCLCIVDSALIKKYASAETEIIRCKDCKHRDVENGFCEGRG